VPNAGNSTSGGVPSPAGCGCMPVRSSPMARTDLPRPVGRGMAPADRSSLGQLRNFRTQLSTAWRHPGNEGRRIEALGRVSWFHVKARAFHARTRVPIGDHSKMWADRGFACTVELVLGNPPDWPYMQAWRSFLRPDTLFVDVGANAGLYSIWAADLGSEVIAVEPEPEVRRALAENAALNGYHVEIVAAALASEIGEMRLTQRFGPMNHLLPDDSSGGIAVAVRTLDDVLGDRMAHGVKIDVEGAEHLVLKGGPVAIAERRLPVIQLEWNGASKRVFGEGRQVVAELLAASGYDFYRPDEHGRLQPTDTNLLGSDIFALLDQP
jgi:FkbM family methyltransferase